MSAPIDQIENVRASVDDVERQMAACQAAGVMFPPNLAWRLLSECRSLLAETLRLNTVLAHRTAQLDRLTVAAVEAVEIVSPPRCSCSCHTMPGSAAHVAPCCEPQFVPGLHASHDWLAGKCLGCGIDLDEDRVARTEPCDKDA